MKQAILKTSNGGKKTKEKLKNLMIKTLFILLSLSFYSAYSQNNIKGSYSPSESKCKLNLIIDENNHFIFNSSKRKVEGTLKISKENKILYIDFANGISGMFQNDTISIQNSGNAINEYYHFTECDEKFIHFIKNNNQQMKRRYCKKK